MKPTPTAPSSESPSAHASPEPAAATVPVPTWHEVLPNGLTILLRESRRAPVVELQIWAQVGSADERPGEEGLAHFHEHMLFKGTERRGVGEVAGDVEGLGGQINAYTSFDQTVYHATLPAAAWRDGLDVLVDAVRHSVFDPEEVAREREVVLEEIRRSEDTPGHVLGDLAFRECYRVHPYGAPILGPAANVASFDRARVRAFFERWYTPENLMVVAVGDFDARQVADAIREHFADAPRGDARRTRPEEPAHDGVHVKLLRRPFEGHRVDLSWPAPRFADPDAVHLDLLAYALGECESSRLVQRIREDEALVDRIDAGAYTPLDRGLFSVGFETDAARLREALGRIVEETDRLRREPIGPAELERARVNFLASEQFERESVAGVASRLGSFESIGGGWAREADFLATLRAATPEDLRRAAERWLDPRGLVVAALVPESTDAAIDEAALRAAVEAGLAAARAASTRDADDTLDDEEGTTTDGAVDSRPATPETRPPARVGGDVVPLPTAAEVVRRLPVGPRRARSAPPAPGEDLRLDVRLANGLDVHVRRRPEVPVVAMRFAAPGGLLAEDEARSGLTRFLNAMWTRGTRARSAAAFARATEALAAEIDGFSGRNSLGLTLDTLAETLDPAMALFAEALQAPAFDPEEIDRERRETLAALDRREDRLGQRAFQLFTREEFAGHPYALTVLGERASIEAIDRAALEAHAARLIRADRAAIAVVGDVDPEAAVRMVENRLGGLPTDGGDFGWPAASARPEGLREATLHKDRAQAHLVVGFRGLTIDDPDRHALELIAQLLAGQGGRLFLELRDRQSLAYTVSASNVEGLAPGYFSLYIATAPDKLERARAGLFEEVERLRAEPPDAEELARAIRYGVGSFAIDAQRSHARAAHIALDAVYGLGPDHSDAYPERLAAVTPDDILRVARRLLRPESATIAAVHP